MFYKPKKAAKLYECIIAHRGLQIDCPENTLLAYEQGAKKGFAIELDTLMLKDGKVVCFQDIYTKRLLGVPGMLRNFSFERLKKYNVKGSKLKVPALEEALECIGGRVVSLIEPKGHLSHKYLSEIKRITNGYNGEVYFHTKNLRTYFILKSVWGKRVNWILNPFRKRYNFLKGKEYFDLPKLPSIDNFIVEAEDSVENIIKKLYSYCNKNTTRVKDGHWLLKYNGMKCQIAHRGIVNPRFKENSLEAFAECIAKDKVIELDVMESNGNLVVYHLDTLSNFIGQEKSCASKCEILDAPSFKGVLDFIGGRVPIIIDIKDTNIFNRDMEKEIIKCLENYKGEFTVQSFNPLVLIFFEKNKPQYIRGQVTHSLKDIRFRKLAIPIANYLLRYNGKPDYIVSDLHMNIHIFSRFNNIIGLPVILYAPKEGEDLSVYEGFADNFIVEGNWQ